MKAVPFASVLAALASCTVPGLAFSPIAHGWATRPTTSLLPRAAGGQDGEPLSLETIALQWAKSAQGGLELLAPGSTYTQELYSVNIKREGGLGLVLTEMFATEGKQNRGLVLVEEVTKGSNADQAGVVLPGDTIMSVSGTSVEGKDWDFTVDAIANAPGDVLELKMKRLVPQARVRVSVTGGDGKNLGTFECAAGSNLRMEMLRRNLPKGQIYDYRTRRFDAVGQAGGNCGGEGTCGTCLVAITSGMDLIVPPGRVEKQVLVRQDRPPRWRWSCRTILGADNKGGDVAVQLQPQLEYEEEREKVVGV